MRNNGEFLEPPVDPSAENVAYSEAWQAFKSAAIVLEAAKEEFMRASKVYEAMLRARIHAEGVKASMISPDNSNATVLRPILRDSTLKDYDVGTFSEKHS